MSLVANFLEVRENQARRSNRVIAWRLWRTLGEWVDRSPDEGLMKERHFIGEFVPHEGGAVRVVRAEIQYCDDYEYDGVTFPTVHLYGEQNEDLGEYVFTRVEAVQPV